MKAFVVERLLSLAAEQTEPKKFYAYDTLRGYGIAGKADIVKHLAELSRHGVYIAFPSKVVRDRGNNGKPKRGILLIRKGVAKDL